jgi:Flp pilus assembly protein TadD
MKGDSRAAIQDCQQAIRLNPRYANAYNNLGNIYNRTGDLPQALQNYNQAIALAPADSLAYNNRAAIYYAMKQYDQAWADLRSCEALGGTPHAGLVHALIQAGNPAKAQ